MPAHAVTLALSAQSASRSGAAITPPRLRQDIADPTEKPDRADPTLAIEPMANAEAMEPIDPTDRIDPALPIERIEPFELASDGQALHPDRTVSLGVVESENAGYVAFFQVTSSRR